MASWSDKVSKITQNAISKSKEVAGITKLNVEIGSLNQDIKTIQTQVGTYVLDNGFLLEDSYIAELVEKANSIKAEIEEKNEKIMELKNVTICTGCGKEVSRNSKFCEHCGAEIVIKVRGTEVSEEETVKSEVEVVVTEITPENSEEAGETEAKQEAAEECGCNAETDASEKAGEEAETEG